jgi:integrase
MTNRSERSTSKSSPDWSLLPSHHTRDASIIELILQTGIRLSEAVRLTLDDIELPTWINRDPDNTGSILVREKGGTPVGNAGKFQSSTNCSVR